MLIFEANYRDEFVEIPSEEFTHLDGPLWEAFFAFIEEEGEALAARVRLRATGHIVEQREYNDER